MKSLALCQADRDQLLQQQRELLGRLAKAESEGCKVTLFIPGCLATVANSMYGDGELRRQCHQSVTDHCRLSES